MVAPPPKKTLRNRSGGPPTFPVMIWLTVLSVSISVQARDDGVADEPPPGAGTRIADADGSSLKAFHSALRATERGESKTRILQFGASHTAADILTGRMRRVFQVRFGDGGHGYFMPARPWRTYRHQDIKFENSKSKRYRWHWDFVRHSEKPWCHEDGLLGLAGMSVRAEKRQQYGRFRTSNRGHGSRASLLEIFYMTQPRGGDLYLKIDGARKRKRIRTKGKLGLRVFTHEMAEGPHQFELRPRGNGEVRLYGAVMERDAPGVVIDTLGINGARAASMLEWNFGLWKTLVRRRDPALVVLAYGTNESGDVDEPIRIYRRNLRRVLKRVRKAAPKASCVLFGPTDRPIVHKTSRKDPLPSFTRRPRTELIVKAQREIAAQEGCGFWDAVAATGGPFSIVSWAHATPRLAYKDYVHLTSRGYRVLADRFVEALLAGYTP